MTMGIAVSEETDGFYINKGSRIDWPHKKNKLNPKFTAIIKNLFYVD